METSDNYSAINFIKLISNNKTIKYGIYILKRGDLLDTNIYKIGKTERSLYTRHNEYKFKNTTVLYYLPVDKVNALEQLIIYKLKKNNNLIFRSDIGNEYFEGEYNIILNTINDICNDYRIEHDVDIENYIKLSNENHKPTLKSKNNLINNETIDSNNIENNDKKHNNSLCKRCGKNFEFDCLLIRHLKRDNKCYPILTDIDTNILVNEINDNRPTKIIDGEKKYICNYCNKIYNSAKGKSLHIKKCKLKINKINNNVSNIPILNNKIDNNLSNNTELTNSNNYCLCKRCGKGFEFNYSLIRHLKSNNKCQPSLSNIDTDILINEINNKKPTKIIDGKKIFICNYCNKVYQSAKGKSIHTKTCKLNKNSNKEPSIIIT